jgi:hypothetical protein
MNYAGVTVILTAEPNSLSREQVKPMQGLAKSGEEMLAKVLAIFCH